VRMYDPFYQPSFFQRLAYGLFILCVVALGLFGLWLMVYGSQMYACESKAEKMSLQSDYGVFTGCMVKSKSGWLPIDGVREVLE
jgi:hypothetical protein